MTTFAYRSTYYLFYAWPPQEMQVYVQCTHVSGNSEETIYFFTK